MAVSTSEAAEEKTDNQSGQNNLTHSPDSIRKSSGETCRRTASLCFKGNLKEKTKIRKHDGVSLSHPSLSGLCSDEKETSSTNDKTNEKCDQEKCINSGQQNLITSIANDTTVITDSLNRNFESNVSNENECTLSDIVEFIDNSVDESITLENNKLNHCDAPLSESPFTSLDKISFEDYKDAQSFGEKNKKYSTSSHKVQFADMAVFDKEGDIQSSPMRPKTSETSISNDDGTKCMDRNTNCPSVERHNSYESSDPLLSKNRFDSCNCSSNASKHRYYIDATANENNNGSITSIPCKKYATINGPRRERTMSECSYFSNVSSISLASKLTTGSDSSDTSSSSSSTESFSHVAPDGGWGWVIVFASFLVNMIADGVTFSVGVMFVDFQKEFGHSKSRTAGVIGLFHAIPLLSGPIASALTDRYGCRKVTIAGSILATLGFLLSSFANTLEVLYLTFGILSGFGLSLCYVAAVVIVAYYFERRRSFATGISVCGSGVGTFVFAPLTRVLIEEYGWRGACVILAGCFLNMCVCGALFRDLEWTVRKRKKKKMKHKLSLTKSISPTPDNDRIAINQKRASIGSSINQNSRRISTPMKMPEIEELRLQILEGGDLSLLYSEEELADNAYLTSSLCHLPTWISNAKDNEGSSNIPEEFLNVLSRNEKACNMIKINYPESLIAVSLKDSASKQTIDLYTKEKQNEYIDHDVPLETQPLVKSPSAKPTEYMNGKHMTNNGDTVLNSTHNDDKKANHVNNRDSEKVSRINTPKLVRKVSGYFKKCQKLADTSQHQEINQTPKSILKKDKHVRYERDGSYGANIGTIYDERNSYERNSLSRTYTCRRSSGTDALIRHKNLTQQRSMYLHRLRLRRQSMTYRGAMLNIPRYRLRSSNSCPDIFRNSMTTLAAEEFAIGDQSIMSPMYWMNRFYDEHFRYCCALPGCSFDSSDNEGCRGLFANWRKIMNISFIMFLISNFILYAWYDVMYVYLLDYTEKELSFSSTDSTFLLSVIGIINTIGEVLIGWVGDQEWTNLNALYAACMLACGIATASVPFLTMYKALAFVAGLFGFAISANYSLTSPMLVNMVSIDEFSNAYGLLLLIQGVSNLVGPPFAGYLYDISKVWYYTFGFGGIFITLSGIFVVILPCVYWVKSFMEQSKETNDMVKVEKDDIENESFSQDNKTRKLRKESDNPELKNEISKKEYTELRLVDTEVIFEGSVDQNTDKRNTSQISEFLKKSDDPTSGHECPVQV